MPPIRPDLREDDSDLLTLARAGDSEAFGKLVTRHQKRVWLVCRQYLDPDDADGATQDSFIKAFTNLGAFDGRAAFTTWLTRIAINTCLDHIRRRRRRGKHIEGEVDNNGVDPLSRLPDDRVGPEDHTMHRQTVRRLAELERALPERQREIFRLRFYAEMELDDIAAALGVHVGTVKTQLHRSVHRLRRELGDLR